MEVNQQHLYRGTTPDWPGNETTQRLRQTCAATDPPVATQSVVPTRNFGSAAVYLFEIREVDSAIAVRKSPEFELPVQLPGDQRLTRALEISYQRGNRLDIVQKWRFDDAVLGGKR